MQIRSAATLLGMLGYILQQNIAPFGVGGGKAGPPRKSLSDLTRTRRVASSCSLGSPSSHFRISCCATAAKPRSTSSVHTYTMLERSWPVCKSSQHIV